MHGNVSFIEPDYYDRALRSIHGLYHYNRYRVAKKYIEEAEGIFSENSEIRILDIGCNGGTFTRQIIKPNVKVVGIDIYSPFIYRANEVIGDKIDLVVGAAEYLPFRTNLFDMVICLEVLEHSRQPLKFINEVYRVLVPGGIVIIMVPNEKSLVYKLVWGIWKRISKHGAVWNSQHFVSFDIDRIRTLLKGRFRIIKMNYINFTMLIIVMARRV